MLGECLSAQGKHEEAEWLLINGYQGQMARAATLPTPQRRLQEALQRLNTHYESLARGEEVARWRAELEQLQATPPEQNTTPPTPPAPTEEPGKAKE